MSLRRARPTLHVLREDLVDGWNDPWPRRALARGDLTSLHPFFALPHPIVSKACTSFGEDPSEDASEGPIAAVTSLTVMEIKSGQWRGGVWLDDRGVCWLIAAGLAKGGHHDRDDFYERLSRIQAQGATSTLLPSREDVRLWKREVAAQLLTEWEVSIQQAVIEALERVGTSTTAQISIGAPLGDKRPDEDRLVMSVTLTVTEVRDNDYEADEFMATMDVSPRWAGSDTAWQATLRVLISICPPEQGWERVKDTFSTIAEPGWCLRRLPELRQLASTRELAESRPGDHAHFAHKRDLSDATIEGRAVRALCGAWFVPGQDHETLPTCNDCDRIMMEIDAGTHP